MDSMAWDSMHRAAVDRHMAGHLDEAEGIYRNILAGKPDHAPTLHRLGCLMFHRGKMDHAMELIQQSVRINPNDFGAWHNLGEVFRTIQQHEQAAEAYQHALAQNNGFSRSRVSLGKSLFKLGRYEDALKQWLVAAEKDAANADLWFDIGTAYQMRKMIDQAKAAFEMALKFNPRHALAWNNLGWIHQEAFALDEAAMCYTRSIESNPQFAPALSNLGMAMVDFGEIESGMQWIVKSINLEPDNQTFWSNYLYAMHFVPGVVVKDLLREHRWWSDRLAGRCRQYAESPNNRDPDRRLRVGFVSGDFRSHTVAGYILPLFRELDRKQVEVFCYNNTLLEDSSTVKCRELADHWVDTVGLDDDRLADRIKSDAIDILVDLSCHTAGNRLPVFARKPAPVQVSWLGYPSTTGLKAMDWRLSDGWIDPVGQHDEDYVEKTVRLKTYWAIDPMDNAAEVGESPFVQNGFVTFGCLCQSKKINGEMVRTFAEILESAPGSRMIILGRCKRTRERIMRGMGQLAGRVEFMEQTGREAYFRTLGRIDVVLDTFPYNGPSTAIDALWMGAPVVSLAGVLGVGRGTQSVLNTLGQGDWVGKTREEYIKIALDLAGDRARLASLRQELRGRMLASPLTDVGAFARDMEQAFREMWRQWVK